MLSIDGHAYCLHSMCPARIPDLMCSGHNSNRVSPVFRCAHFGRSESHFAHGRSHACGAEKRHGPGREHRAKIGNRGSDKNRFRFRFRLWSNVASHRMPRSIDHETSIKCFDNFSIRSRIETILLGSVRMLVRAHRSRRTDITDITVSSCKK